LIDHAVTGALHVNAVMHAARTDDVLLHERTAAIVMYLEAVVAAAVIDDVIDELDPIEAEAGAVIFEVKLIAVLTVVERPGATRIGPWPSIMDIGILHGDARHRTAAGLEGDTVVRGIPAFEAIDRNVFGGGTNRIDTGMPS